MKTYFIFLCLLAGGGLASATTQTKSSPDKPPRLYVESYTQTEDWPYSYRFDTYDNNGNDYEWDERHITKAHIDYHWNDGVGGGGSMSQAYNWTGSYYGTGYSGNYVTWSKQSWPTSSWPNLAFGTQTVSPDELDWPDYDPNIAPPGIISEHCNFNYPFKTAYQFYEDEVYGLLFPHDIETDWWDGKYVRTADVVWKLQTGGKALSQRQNLWCVSASATQLTPYNESQWQLILGYSMTGVPNQNIIIDGKHLNEHGKMWRLYADGDTRDLTPHVPGVDYYTFNLPMPTEYLSQFEVFVRQPDSLNGHDYNNPENPYPFGPYVPVPGYICGSCWGHAWWGMWCDASVDQIIEANNQLHFMTNSTPLQWLGRQVGFGPENSAHGKLINPDGGAHNRYQNYEIGFPELIAGLNFTESTSNSPPKWVGVGIYPIHPYTCASCAIDAAGSVGITLPMTKYPEELGNELPPNNPPDH
jgi:hypothetical protein